MKWNFQIALLCLLAYCGADDPSDVLSTQDFHYGIWTSWEECEANTFVNGFDLKVDPGGGLFYDDRGMTGLRLICSDADGNEKSVLTPKEAKGGAWMYQKTPCAIGWAVGFTARVESYRGIWRDDSAVNNFKILCSSGHRITGGGTGQGFWESWKYCPDNEYICAVRIKIEGNYAINPDEVGVISINVRCCLLNTTTVPPTTTTITTTTTTTTTTTSTIPTTTTPLTTPSAKPSSSVTTIPVILPLESSTTSKLNVLNFPDPSTSISNNSSSENSNRDVEKDKNPPESITKNVIESFTVPTNENATAEENIQIYFPKVDIEVRSKSTPNPFVDNSFFPTLPPLPQPGDSSAKNDSSDSVGSEEPSFHNLGSSFNDTIIEVASEPSFFTPSLNINDKDLVSGEGDESQMEDPHFNKEKTDGNENSYNASKDSQESDFAISTQATVKTQINNGFEPFDNNDPNKQSNGSSFNNDQGGNNREDRTLFKIATTNHEESEKADSDNGRYNNNGINEKETKNISSVFDSDIPIMFPNSYNNELDPSKPQTEAGKVNNNQDSEQETANPNSTVSHNGRRLPLPPDGGIFSVEDNINSNSDPPSNENVDPKLQSENDISPRHGLRNTDETDMNDHEENSQTSDNSTLPVDNDLINKTHKEQNRINFPSQDPILVKPRIGPSLDAIDKKEHTVNRKDEGDPNLTGFNDPKKLDSSNGSKRKNEVKGISEFDIDIKTNSKNVTFDINENRITPRKKSQSDESTNLGRPVEGSSEEGNAGTNGVLNSNNGIHRKGDLPIPDMLHNETEDFGHTIHQFLKAGNRGSKTTIEEDFSSIPFFSLIIILTIVLVSTLIVAGRRIKRKIAQRRIRRRMHPSWKYVIRVKQVHPINP